jgi:hypothetical protein
LDVAALIATWIVNDHGGDRLESWIIRGQLPVIACRHSIQSLIIDFAVLK